MPDWRTTSRAIALMLLVVAILGVRLEAHPLSTFGAQLNVSGRVVSIILNADAEPLLRKLDVLGGSTSAGLTTLDRLNSHRSLIEARSLLRADGRAVPLTASPARFTPDGQVEVTLTGELPGGTTAVTWQSRLVFGTYPISVTYGADDTESLHWIDGQEATIDIPVRPTGAPRAAFARYVELGFVHILPKGLDHILFILGLFMLAPRVAPLLAQVTVFTCAHSVSLALGITGAMTLPPAVVEPLIALSIVYVGIENLYRSSLSRGRLWLVGAFGLLHGLGFAGVLADLSLPGGQWLPALAGFNVGVELGQLAVIAMAGLASIAWTRAYPAAHGLLRRVTSAAIAVAGLFWVVTRII